MFKNTTKIYWWEFVKQYKYGMIDNLNLKKESDYSYELQIKKLHVKALKKNVYVKTTASQNNLPLVRSFVKFVIFLF